MERPWIYNLILLRSLNALCRKLKRQTLQTLNCSTFSNSETGRIAIFERTALKQSGGKIPWNNGRWGLQMTLTLCEGAITPACLVWSDQPPQCSSPGSPRMWWWANPQANSWSLVSLSHRLWFALNMYEDRQWSYTLRQTHELSVKKDT